MSWVHPDLREEFIEERDDLLVLAGQVVQLDALLEHAPPLRVGRNGLDHSLRAAGRGRPLQVVHQAGRPRPVLRELPEQQVELPGRVSGDSVGLRKDRLKVENKALRSFKRLCGRCFLFNSVTVYYGSLTLGLSKGLSGWWLVLNREQCPPTDTIGKIELVR